MIQKKIFVKKMNGDLEEYDEIKLKNSLIKAGANEKTIDSILKRVSAMIYSGIETKKLFKFVFGELKKEKTPSNLKYNLKNAIINLRINGGFVFEKFIGELFKKMGYEILLNEIVNGKFVSHEIDVTAKKGKEILMIEAKHHKNPWLGEQIQTALYVYARFLDLTGKFTKPLLVTNTKFSNQVIQYSKGVGIGLMGWNYPAGSSLAENIEKYKLYPITLLPLSKREIDFYLEKKILTLQDLRNTKGVSKELVKKIDELLND